MEATGESMTRKTMIGSIASVVVGLTLAVLTSGSLHKPKQLSHEPASGAQSLRGFACGSLSCDSQTSYCETINTDVPALPSNYACRPLPAACLPSENGAPRDCRCFPAGTRGDYCSAPLSNGNQFFYRTSIGGH